MSERNEPATSKWHGWWIALLIALPIGALFGPALVSDSSFATRDAGHFYYPLFQWTCQEWATGRVPLWNPLEAGGSPVVADASSSVFYPGKLLFALPVSYSLRFKLYVVAHVVLAAVGAFRLARTLSCSSEAAAAAAVAYSCGGSVAFQYCNVVFLVGAAWLPWAWIELLNGMRAPRVAAAVRLAVVLTLMVLGGDPQMAVHVMLCGLLYLVVEYFSSTPTEGISAESITARPRGRRALVHCGFLAATIAIAFGLSAGQILPSREAASESIRAAFFAPRNVYEAAAVAFTNSTQGDGAENEVIERPGSEIFRSSGPYSHQADVYEFSIGPWRFAELFWPNVFGRMFPTHGRWIDELPAEGRIWTPTLYLGLLTSVLGLWQLRMRSGEVMQRWLTWTFFLFAVGSLGWYGLGWFLRELYASLGGGDSDQLGIAQPVGGVYWFLVTFVPGYVQFRFPAKLLVVASLALSLLAAKGWDAALRQPSRWLNIALLSLAAASLLGLLGSFILGRWFAARAWAADPAFGPFDAAGALADIRFAFLQALFVASLALILLQVALRRGNAVWGSLMLALLAMDLAVANSWFVATAPSRTWRVESELTAQLPESISPARLYRVRAAHWWPDDFETSSSPHRMAEICGWEHQTLFPKHHLLSGVELADSSSSLRPVDRDSFWRVARQLRGPGSVVPHEGALQLTGTRYVAAPPDFQPAATEHWEMLSSPKTLDGQVRLWQVPSPLPKAWVVHQVDALPPLASLDPHTVDRRTTQVLLKGTAVRDFRRHAVVETDQPLVGFSQIGSGEASAGCRVTQASPQRVIVDVELTRAGLLVINQPYASGWVARQQTDGGAKELPLLRTNRILQGLVLPPGEHRVELSYEPASFYVGAAVSFMAWLALFVGAAITIARRQRGAR